MPQLAFPSLVPPQVANVRVNWGGSVRELDVVGGEEDLVAGRVVRPLHGCMLGEHVPADWRGHSRAVSSYSKNY